MKCSAKRLLALVMTVVMALSMMSVVSFAAEETVTVAEGTATFASESEAANGKVVVFTPETNGDVTLDVASSDPGYLVVVYADGDYVEEFFDSKPGQHTFAVTSGVEYELVFSSQMIYGPSLKMPAPGSVSYKVSFLSNGEVSGDQEPVDPSLVPGLTQSNPKIISGTEQIYIEAGQTMWYLYNVEEETKPDSMMLHIISGVEYSAVYAGQAVPVDEGGFVNYEMVDTAKLGQYQFSVTNTSAGKGFFNIEVRKCLPYVISDVSLRINSNNLTLDGSKEFTLFEFTPTTTGVYTFRTNAGFVSEWGTSFNPVNNTSKKTQTLEWTCTAVGQAVMIGLTGTKTARLMVIRTGDYVPPVEIPWVYYENTYDFSYQMPENPVMVDVDLTDGGSHDAFLGSDGFYHYGSICGPLMVADLSKVEINLAEAYTNGGLRAWLQDENQETISKVDYNEAMNAYYQAGLVPVTEELATMLMELGQANSWWNENGFVFAETAPADLSNVWMQLCGYLEGSDGHQYVDGVCNYCGAAEPTSGVTLSGTIVSFGAEEPVMVELSMEGQTGQGMMSTDGTYSFDGVSAGTYILKISKLNHVTREYEVVIGEENVVQDVKIHLIGDVNGDGRVNTGDVSKIYAHAKKSTLLEGYEFLCADINGDGRVNTGDTSKAYAHAKKTSPLW